MPQIDATGADRTQDVETQTTENEDVETQDTDAEGDLETDDQNEGLPKTKEELNKLLQNRLNRQKNSLEKKHQADLKKVTEQKDKSDLELEQQKSKDLVGKITDKNFLLAAKDAGASQTGAEKLLKLFRSEFETDDDGEITNIEDVLESAQKDFEELFNKKKKGSGDGGAGGGKVKDPVKEFNDSIKAGLGFQ